MRLIIDGDGCPQNVRKICEEFASYYGIQMIVVSSYDHEMRGEFDNITVEKGKDSADFKVIEISGDEDVVITQDFGLASLLMAKVYAIINPLGFLYTPDNMDKLLMNRYMGQKIRRSGGRTKGPKKRRALDDNQFEEILMEVIKKKLKS